MSHDSVTQASKQVVEKLYADAKRGDAVAVFSVMSEDLVVYEPSFLPYGGTYRGHEGFHFLFEKIGSLIDYTGLRLDSLVAQDERVIGVLYLPLIGGDGGITLAEESIVRDGKVVQMRIFIHDAGSLVPKSS